MKRRPRYRDCRGQATAELLAASIGLVLVFAAVGQICLVGDAAAKNLLESRERADRYSMTNNQVSRETRYYGVWDVGDDGLRYTADDDASGSIGASIGYFHNEMNQPMTLNSLSAMGANDQITPYSGSGSAMWSSNLFKGEATDQVLLDEALRNLLFINTRRIKIEDASFMPGLEISD
jgi:hypothetical protein